MEQSNVVLPFVAVKPVNCPSPSTVKVKTKSSPWIVKFICRLLSRLPSKFELDSATYCSSGSRILTGVEVGSVVSGFITPSFRSELPHLNPDPHEAPVDESGVRKQTTRGTIVLWTCSSERSGPGLFARLSRTGLEDRNAMCHSRARR